MKVSTVIITKNEEDRLEKCLSSVNWTDEIIVLDSGSSDNTCQIARSFGAKVFIQENWQGFGYQRQFALEKATGDWVFVIDADEVVSCKLRDEIIKKIESSTLDVAYAVPRMAWVFGRFLKHCWYPDYIVRLFPREKAKYETSDLVHEKVHLNVRLEIKLQNHLLHFPYRDLSHFLSKSNSYATAWAKQRFSDNKKTNILKVILHTKFSFIKNYFIKKGFLDGKQGFLVAVLGACQCLISMLLY